MAVKTHVTTETRPGEELRNLERVESSVTMELANKALFGPLHESLRNRSPSSESICDACIFCEDTCGNPDCPSCSKKPQRQPSSGEAKPFPFAVCDASDRTFTRCQLRRHCTEESAWLLCGNTIYDATPFLEIHPGGKQSILRKAGGVCDCTMDMNMHSKGAIRRWKSKKVGKLRKCEREAVINATEDQCVIA
jgi:cytochrome b involved in lipid metabolism